MSQPRKGEWIQTRSGVAYYPLDPRMEEVRLVDIVWSLCNQCRWGGHCRFYVVGEHSVRVSRLVEEYLKDQPDRVYAATLAFAALMHDAAEAYLVDLPRPVKVCMPDYKFAERLNEQCIASHFGLQVTAFEEPHVKLADAVLGRTEHRDLMGPAPQEWGPAQGSEIEPLPKVIEPWSRAKARRRFMRRAQELWLAMGRSPEELEAL